MTRSLALVSQQMSKMAETRGSIPIDASQSYKVTDLCLEPTTFFVKKNRLTNAKAEFIAEIVDAEHLHH